MFHAARDLESHYTLILDEILGKRTAPTRKLLYSHGKNLKSLQRGLTGERTLVGETYMEESRFLSSYLLYYWPVSYLQVYSALSELAMTSSLPKIRSILDIGAGSGPAACACRDFGAESALLLDGSAIALGWARRICSGNSARISRDSMKALFSASTETLDLESLKVFPAGPFDLIVACHSVNELWKNERGSLGLRTDFLLKAFDRLTPGGILLVVEPSTLATSRPALELRDRLLEKLAGTATCPGPCPGSYPCPILRAGPERTCHSTWRWSPPPAVEELAKIAGLERDSVKATWYALKKTPSGEPRTEAKSAAGEFPQAAEAAGEGSAWPSGRLSGRVVSEPMLNKAGRVRIVLCSEAGLSTVSAPKGWQKAQSSGFLELARGDRVDFSGLERRSGDRNFGFAENSTLRITLKAPRCDSGRSEPPPKGGKCGEA